MAFVHENSPAEIAGIQVGDVVTRFDGVAIYRFAEFAELVRQHQPGETVRMQVLRGAKKLNLDVTIDRRS